MDLKPLPFWASLEQYQEQAEEVLEAHRSGDPQAIRMIHENHLRFLDSQISWPPKNLSDSEIQNAALELADAQLTLARWHSFQNWPTLAEYVQALTRDRLRPRPDGKTQFKFHSGTLPSSTAPLANASDDNRGENEIRKMDLRDDD